MARDSHDSVTKDEPGDPKNVGKSTTGRCITHASDAADS